MAYSILQRPTNPHKLAQDMESLLYVVLNSSLRWLPHNLDANELYNVIWNLFTKSQGQYSPGLDAGGDAKFPPSSRSGGGD